MKKVGMSIIAFALLIVFISGIQAIQVIGNNQTSNGKVQITGKSMTGESISGKASTTAFHLNITVIPLVPNISIISPENITYNFSSYAPLVINLNTTSNFAVSSWWYTLIDLRHNEIAKENISFFPNTNFTAVRGKNRMIVYANNSTGYTTSASVEFYVYVNRSNPIIHLRDNTNILACQNSSLSYFFNISDLDEDVIETYFIPEPATRILFGDPFSIKNTTEFDYYNFSYKVNHTMWAYEIVSKFLNKTYVGGINNGSARYEYHPIAFDGIGADYKTLYLTVIEVNTPPNLTTNPGVNTIYSRGENSTFYYEFEGDDVEDGPYTSGNLTWSVNFSGEHLFSINPNGIINYTSNTTNSSVNNITVCITDLGLQRAHPNITLCNDTGLNSSTCINFSLTITNDNRPPNITSHYPSSLLLNTSGTITLDFNITTYDPDGTVPDARWYVNDILQEYDSGSFIDEYRYTFPCGISGNHTVKVIITDGLLQDSRQWNISLSQTKCPTINTGGGGTSGGFCIPKWVCKDWGSCSNLRQDLEQARLFGEGYRLVKEECALLGLKDEECGFQSRICTDTHRCDLNKSQKTQTQQCHYIRFPNCKDKVKNCHHGECELLIDCGGPCSQCPTCSDNIKNQGEEGVDCGGPCPWACEPGKPTPPKQHSRYSLLLLILILVLYLINKSYRLVEKKVESKKRILIPTFLIIALLFSGIFLYFYSSFNVGDFVYKKNIDMVGEIINISATLNPLVQWQNGKSSRESIFSIGKVDDLTPQNIEEILRLNNQKGYSLYSWSKNGTVFDEETPIKQLKDLKDYTVQTKEEDCIPSFICQEWSECKVDYNIKSISGKESTHGTRSRLCKDYGNCMADFVYSETCEIKDQVSVQTTKIEEGEFLEIYDINNNIVARITRQIFEGIEKLNIEIVI